MRLYIAPNNTPEERLLRKNSECASRRGHGIKHGKVLFGELTALDDDYPRSAEVITLEPSTCLAMKGTDFRKFLLQNPPALMKVAQRLARQVRESNIAVIMNTTI